MAHSRDFLTVPMPERIARLPRDKRGYPIPFTADIREDGTPDFTAINVRHWIAATRDRRCGICGVVMHSRVWFVGGPICEINRLFYDHPMHQDCAEYALRVCPFLAMPNAHYRKIKSLREGVAIVKTASDVKPDRFMLGRTKGYRVMKVNDDVLLRADPWEDVVWWKDGEVMVPTPATLDSEPQSGESNERPNG
jgi:hypothetical protein